MVAYASAAICSAGPKGGPGGHVPPEEAASALKKKNFFHALYDIASIYGNA